MHYAKFFESTNADKALAATNAMTRVQRLCNAVQRRRLRSGYFITGTADALAHSLAHCRSKAPDAIALSACGRLHHSVLAGG